jgi:DNA-directed RNA polymerase specialized sigma24 family protein
LLPPLTRLTGQQRDAIRARYQDGETADHLAAEFGLTAGEIRRIGGKRE